MKYHQVRRSAVCLGKAMSGAFFASSSRNGAMRSPRRASLLSCEKRISLPGPKKTSGSITPPVLPTKLHAELGYFRGSGFKSEGFCQLMDPVVGEIHRSCERERITD